MRCPSRAPFAVGGCRDGSARGGNVEVVVVVDEVVVIVDVVARTVEVVEPSLPDKSVT